MKLPTVDKFVFYFSLEIGAMILAGLSIAMSVSIIAVATSFLVRYATFFSTLNETDQDFFRQFLISKLNTIKNNNNLITLVFAAFIVVYTIYILYFGIVFVAAIMLIIGTRNVRIYDIKYLFNANLFHISA